MEDSQIIHSQQGTEVPEFINICLFKTTEDNFISYGRKRGNWRSSAAVFPNKAVFFFFFCQTKRKEPSDFGSDFYPIWTCQFSFCGPGWIIKSQILDSRGHPVTLPAPPPHLLKGCGGTQGGVGTECGTRGVRLVSARHTDAPLIPHPSAQDTFRDSLVKGKGHLDLKIPWTGSHRTPG